MILIIVGVFFVKDAQCFEDILLDFGFQDELQEDHGQLYGYVLRVSDKLQHHIKVIPDGNIESEMEPPSAYPAAHLNSEHIYSAYQETEQVLRLARIGYDILASIPSTCIAMRISFCTANFWASSSLDHPIFV